jgi:hypothetical protein
VALGAALGAAAGALSFDEDSPGRRRLLLLQTTPPGRSPPGLSVITGVITTATATVPS